MSIFLAVVGIAILVTGGSFLVKGAVSLSHKIGISGFVIGLTVVAYGTSAPELFASVLSIPAHQEIVLGNVAGSNIANVGMVAGIMLLLGAGFGAWREHSYEFMAACGASIAVLLLLLDGVLGLFDGIILCIMGGVSTMLVLRRATKAAAAVKNFGTQHGNEIMAAPLHDAEVSTFSIKKSASYLVGGIALLWVGATLTIEGATALGQQIGLSDHVIGLTVIAIGTSLPELTTTLIAIRKGEKSIGMGNIIGSNIANIVLIGGAAGILSGLSVTGGLDAPPTVFFDMVVAAIFTVVFVLAFVMRRVPVAWSIAFLVFYVGWLAYGLVPEIFR